MNIYYDQDFPTENNPWCKLIPEQAESISCKGMLVFGSPRYQCKYACLMELLYFRTEGTRNSRGKVKPIIPIILDDSKKPGMGMMEPDEKLLDKDPRLMLREPEAKFIREKI